jgi:hypothetical protein
MSIATRRFQRVHRVTAASEGTIFGFNTSNTDPERVSKITWWGKVPCGRTYYGNSTLPSDGSGFISGGKEYKCAGLDVAGTISAKRINVCFNIDAAAVTSSSSARAVEAYNYARSVPAGWRVYMTHHEYNRDFTAINTPAAFVNAFQIIAQTIWDANQLNKTTGKGEVLFVVNAAGSGLGGGSWSDSYAPAANTMPPNCQFWADAYDNPSGYPSGHRNYGTRYSSDMGADCINDIYDTAGRLGYLDNSDGGTRGWGVGEFNSPRRVAPTLASINSTLGWGPSSQHDISGAGQAQAITDYATLCLGTTLRPVPAKVVLFWTGAGTNWNHAMQTAGAAGYDAWQNGSGVLQSNNPIITNFTGLTLHPTLGQGWPIAVDPTPVVNAYQPFIDMSP